MFRYAIANGFAGRDPNQDLKGALTTVKTQNYARLTDRKEIAGLNEGYRGEPITRLALRFLSLTFVRQGELRHAEWSEIDLQAKEWRIPAHKMKTKAEHIVPLSKQTLAVLEELHPLTHKGAYLFPSVRSRQRPMSENTINGALRRMGYTKEEMTSHGFRGIASTTLNEPGYDADWIERQLAHAERNKTRAAYNHAQYLKERRKMMNEWADYLDALKAGDNLIPFRQAG